MWVWVAKIQYWQMRWDGFPLRFHHQFALTPPEPDGCIVIVTACLLSTYSSLPLYLCFCYQKNGFFWAYMKKYIWVRSVISRLGGHKILSFTDNATFFFFFGEKMAEKSFKFESFQWKIIERFLYWLNRVLCYIIDTIIVA